MAELKFPFYLKLEDGYLRVAKFEHGTTAVADGELLVEKPAEGIYYVLASNGLYQRKVGFVFEVMTKIWDGKKELGWLAEEEEYIKLKLPKKIPYAIFAKSLSFFRRVFVDRKTEAVLLLYWDEEAKDYTLICPKQKVGGAAVHTYQLPGHEPGKFRVGTIHSHCDFSAGHSGVDCRDEMNEDGIHVTIGHVTALPSLAISLAVDGVRLKLERDDVFEELPIEDIPDEWMEKVKPGTGYGGGIRAAAYDPDDEHGEADPRAISPYKHLWSFGGQKSPQVSQHPKKKK